MSTLVVGHVRQVLIFFVQLHANNGNAVQEETRYDTPVSLGVRDRLTFS